ncbi:putative Zn(II)2Cys6 transcription factor [Purpureocillium lavendulum]|uniref:Zn(II)2Cys6 transcription factor n=1 Tax=Purpureocillium lavendulum TaxID=1247861 RepID=A0AB34FFJ9_9HYPO|nr:putative Zn(II)2Cys6 transcription factor [Purpureocillium lavendulum]
MSLSPASCVSQAARKRPCDRCHSLKERCRWADVDAHECERCSRLQFQCKTNRPVARAGRRPRLAAGNRMSLRRTSLPGRPRTPSSAELSSLSPLSPLSPSSAPSPPPPPRRRPPPPRQAPLAATGQVPDDETAPQEALVVGNGITARQHVQIRHVPQFPELSRLEMHFLDVMLHKQIEVDKYLIGPSFRDQHLQAFATHLAAGMPLLKDAFIACASLLVGNQDLRRLAHGQQIGYRRAAAAIGSLRVSRIDRADDLSMVLILGVAVVTFALHHSGPPLALCSFILGIAKAMYERDRALPQRMGPDCAAFLVCLLGTEMEECLVRCRTPTLRVHEGDMDHLVDRFIGISAPLLTYFYDLCALGHQIRRSGCRALGNAPANALLDDLTTVEAKLTDWRPTISADILATYSDMEANMMMAQAKVLRLTALLVAHRLRHPFGHQDEHALTMSRAVLQELSAVVRLTGRSIPFGDLAFLVAGFELTTTKERDATLARSYLIVDFSPHVRDEEAAWLVSFWAARDATCTRQHIYWDNIEGHLEDPITQT